MKPFTSLVLILAALLLKPLPPLHAAETKPNILLIYSDDHGWADLGIQGVDKDIRTPNLDQLGKDGVRFIRGYVTAPQCVPSRAGVMTGRYQQRFGVEDNNKGPLPLSELTIAERLKPAGYVSGWVGKSHLDIGGEKGAQKSSRLLSDHMPHHQGFVFTCPPGVPGAVVWQHSGIPAIEASSGPGDDCGDGRRTGPDPRQTQVNGTGAEHSDFLFDHPVINLDVPATAAAAAGLPHDPKLDGVNLTPFVTGENKSSPHERLFWRWGSQAAVLEMHYKLIRLGDHPPLLFDLTRPEGEHLERNLALQHPDVVARLTDRLTAWAAELQPPGLSAEKSGFSRHHEEMFAEHLIMKAPPSAESSPDGSIQGWIARSGTLAVKSGALMLTPEVGLSGNGRPFLTHSQLDLPGPVTATLKVRSSSAGQGRASITWRTKTESFQPHQTAVFDWPTNTEWQKVRVPLPEKSRIIHLRITPPKGAIGIEIQSIELQGKGADSRTFRFDNSK